MHPLRLAQSGLYHSIWSWDRSARVPQFYECGDPLRPIRLAGRDHGLPVGPRSTSDWCNVPRWLRSANESNCHRRGTSMHSDCFPRSSQGQLSRDMLLVVGSSFNTWTTLFSFITFPCFHATHNSIGSGATYAAGRGLTWSVIWWRRRWWWVEAGTHHLAEGRRGLENHRGGRRTATQGREMKESKRSCGGHKYILPAPGISTAIRCTADLIE